MKRRVLLLVAGGALILLGFLATPHLLRRVTFFRVRQVELVGLRYIAPDALLETLGLQPDQNVFDDVRGAEERVSQLAGIVQVRIRRRLPGTLRVEVSERIPLAFVQGPEGLLTLDAWARPLPYDPTASSVDLPIVASADTSLVGALGAVRFVSRDLYDEVDWVETDGNGGVRLVLGDRRILLRVPSSPGDVDAVLAVTEHLAGSGREYEELDARYDGWIVVRRRVI
jgi:cell division protein FtsQ